MEIKEIKKIKEMFHCETCDYNTFYNSEFVRHCSTRKHQDFQSRKCPETKNREEVVTEYICQTCNKSFNTNSGLWKHKQKCNEKKNEVVEYLMKENKELKTTMMQIIEQKDEKIAQILDQRDLKLTNLIIEICKSTHPSIEATNSSVISTNNSNNNNVNSNNTFNLQFFLNETCKDAVNLSDFIKSVKTSNEIIEIIAEKGYVQGTSECIIQHLNELGVERRPIQCTDAKRQTLYIKDNNEWFKEDKSFKTLQKLVDDVQRIHLKQLAIWRDYHPNCLTSSSRHTTTYNNMSQELMGGDCKKIAMQDKDNKIINKIIKEVVVDKTLFVSK